MEVWDDIFQSTLPIQGETLQALVEAMRRIFQSTLPIQGETEESEELNNAIEFQSTLPIQGETVLVRHTHYRHQTISIHSPYTGRDR